MDGRIRLQKALAEAGVASRRAAELLISAGRIGVNGQIVTEQGVRVDPTCDRITLDGRVVGHLQPPVYLMLNKPAGVLSTASDPYGRPTVVDLVREAGGRLFPVGRLDFDTEGLLLLTNDGELTNLLLHPRYHVEKRYEAWVRGALLPDELDRLCAGVELQDGLTAPAHARLLQRDSLHGTCLVELILREGRKRQVKRMLAAVGHPVISLRRVAFGPLQVGELAPGAWRWLSADEVLALRRVAGGAE